MIEGSSISAGPLSRSHGALAVMGSASHQLRVFDRPWRHARTMAGLSDNVGAQAGCSWRRSGPPRISAFAECGPIRPRLDATSCLQQGWVALRWTGAHCVGLGCVASGSTFCPQRTAAAPASSTNPFALESSPRDEWVGLGHVGRWPIAGTHAFGSGFHQLLPTHWRQRAVEKSPAGFEPVSVSSLCLIRSRPFGVSRGPKAGQPGSDMAIRTRLGN